jgi:predicted transcriptional regulator
MKEQVSKIVAAFVRKNRLDPTQLSTLIADVSATLNGLGQPNVAPSPLPAPAVAIRRSVGAETISCLDCGQKAKMLKRHLMAAHGMTAAEYRARWSLPKNYPMVSKGYAARRSELAKAAGLGRARSKV